MSTIGKKFVALAVGVGMIVPSLAFADTSSISALLEQIKSLQAKILELQKQQQEVVQQQQEIFAALTVEMQEGSTGDQVTKLQQLLASDPELYPERVVSGYFGRLTALAVKRFQQKYGISPVGRVGPLTLRKFNEIYGHHASSSSGGAWDKRDDDKKKEKDRDDDISLEDLVYRMGKVVLCHKPGKNNRTIYVAIPSITSHLKHGDAFGACKGGSNGNNGSASTTPDTVAPVITSVAASGVSATGATVNWTTNENTTSQVEYGATNSYGTLTTVNNALVTAHGVALTGLTANTMYHYRVWSRDVAGNTGVSGDQTFTTSAAPDTTAPVISAVTAGNVATSGATITWTTNEGATSQVEYGITSSYGALTTLDAALLTSHSVALSGLTDSTTYHYRVISKDAAGNASQSPDMTFITSALADTAAPVISGINVSPIASTSATVNWTTNEVANSKVYYSTSSPLNLGSALSVSSAANGTSHSLGLTGLSATTTYYFVVQSMDAALNTATSSVATFSTSG